MTVTGRVVLVGDTQVGKTSILTQFLHKQIPYEQKSTVGAVFHTHETNVNGKTVSMQIWDTAGQEKYQALGPIYYRNSVAAIAVFDMTDKHTMKNLTKWVDNFRKFSENPYVIIAANKSDLEEFIAVDEEEISTFAKSLGAQYIITSAKTGCGIEEVFDVVSNHIAQIQVERAEVTNIDINNNNNDTKKSRSCC
ncbi:Ras-related protein Rab2BV [Tritrichomonas foetus]|uniref:Ras-related protein Rab2BV n=1 Tax=Tritrichomonas foetus TaxID=1144522 RepID=A0A1J4JGW3_9EUKA|nr:Ras-related protein Rab2BV [Tritrichomonas foetus]|eukprot:OHS97929.1 Ras-related protein Rab2BV [Tritrichomonas foetus]